LLQKRYGSASQCESAKNGLVLSEHRPVLELAVPAENAEARWVIPPNHIVNIHISFLHSLFRWQGFKHLQDFFFC